jgi:hypothetical protein
MRGRKGGRGRRSWALYRWPGMGRGLGLGLDCIGRLGGVVQERDGIQGRKEALTGGVHLSAGGGDGRIPFRVCPGMGHGPNLERGQTVPPRPFLLFLFLFPFSFLFYHFFYIICKNASNQFNHFQKFSKNQCNALTLQEN